MSDLKPAKWEVKQKITGTGDTAKTISQLVCNGRVLHEIAGPNGYDSIKDYADKMNAKREPEPPVKEKIGADGYSFKTPAKKAPGAPKTVMPSMQEWAKKHGLV